MTREIALDTETTGLDPFAGHRVVEIGCVEMRNRIRTGQVFHIYLNPDREMPDEAFRIHGLSAEFLSNKPRFEEIAGDFLEFVGDSPFVIHNAAFDLKFLNWELKRMGRMPFGRERQIVDTLLLARQKFPGAPASLDALCKRFNIDLSARTRHGALLDAELLADMYLELLGGAQSKLELGKDALTTLEINAVGRPLKEPRPHAPTPEEEQAHEEFLKKVKNAIWLQPA